MLIVIGVALLIWFGSIIWAHELGARHATKWIFHAIAWGRYRDSGAGLVNDHGNCLDHEGCPYD